MKEFNNINGEFLVRDETARQNLDIINNVIYSIERFKKQDGDLSDSERIQRAINDLHSNGGGTLLFPNDTYTIGNTLKVYENIALKGISISDTIFNVQGNIKFCEIYEHVERKDSVFIENLSINRNGTGVNTPLVDFSNIGYGFINNVKIEELNGQGANGGSVGLNLGDYSYYNNITNLQIRGFNIGINITTEANGNCFFGGSCISCVKYGVYINKSNSNRFFGHSVELVATYAYFLENKSLSNLFCGCRIEQTQKSFHAKFESGGNSSYNNVAVCCLNYSTDQTDEFTQITNFNASALNLVNSREWESHSTFYATHNFGQGPFNKGEFKQLMCSNIKYNRNSSYTSNGTTTSDFTCKKSGLYGFDIGVQFATAQTTPIRIALKVNGTIVRNQLTYMSNNDTAHNNFTLYLNSGDVVTAWISSTVNSNIQGNDNTYFSGYNL